MAPDVVGVGHRRRGRGRCRRAAAAPVRRSLGTPTAVTSEIVLDADVTDDADADADADRRAGLCRYLNVAATIGQLLPDDLGPLLLSGASVVRREGRLFAIVAVATDSWAAPGYDGADQAKKLADAGFRVEWTTDAPLAC